MPPGANLSSLGTPPSGDVGAGSVASSTSTSTPATLSFDMYPHLADLIIAHAPFASLFALRHASRAVRDRVDTTLVRHVVVCPEAAAHFGTYHRGEYHRLPRSDWYEVRVLLDAVRVIDLAPPLPPICKHDNAASAVLRGRIVDHRSVGDCTVDGNRCRTARGVEWSLGVSARSCEV